MAKHSTKEAYFERLRNLADVNKPSIKESKIRNLGSLIDYKRAADGVAYGIVKENHQYYLKKAGTKQDPNVADFAYIGGMENITGYQFKSLAEADKQRNMIFHNIGGAVQLKPSKTGSKMVITEDVAGKEIDQAASKLGDLDAAASAEAMPAPAPDAGLETDGNAEMSAGLEAEPPAPEGGEEMPAPEAPAPEGGEMPAPEGGEEMPAPEGAPEGGEEMPAPEGGEEPEGDEPEGGESEPEGEENVAATTDGSIDEPNAELEKAIGKITNKIRKTEMEDSQVKSFINSYLSAFKDKLRDIDIEDRKEMANKLLKVVGPEEIDDLGDSVPQDNAENSPEGLPDAGIEEEQCAECGSLPEYAKSRGYDTADSFMECDDEEKSSVISGYANAHNDGQNDGDFKTVAIVITPEILEKLKGEYGHEDYAEKLQPHMDSMNESSDEDKMAKLREGWGDVWGGIKQAGQAIGSAASQATTGIKQAYHGMGMNPAWNKLAAIATDLGKQINAVNTKATKAGQNPVKVNDILSVINKQLTSPDAVGKSGNALTGNAAEWWKAGKTGQQTAGTNVDPSMLKQQQGIGKKPAVEPLKKVAEGIAVDPSNTQVGVPNMIKEDDEPETDEKEFDVNDIKTDDVDDIKTDDVETGGDEEETPFVKSGDKPLSFAPDSQSLGVSTVKPDGAPTTGVDITIDPDKTVNISMNEAKRKLIKQIAEGVNDYLGEISSGYAQQAGQAAGNKIDTLRGNDTIGAQKAGQQKTKFDAYINPELLSYLKSQGIQSAEGYGSNGMYISVPGVNGDTVYIVVGPNEYHFYSQNQDVNSIKPDFITKLPNVIKRVQADLKGEKSRFNPASGQQAPAQPATQPHSEPTPTPMNESERKLRKYVRARLEEKAGMRKPKLNEGKKSVTMQKLDEVIDRQYKLFESVMLKKKGKVNEGVPEIFGRIGQGMEGRFKKQRELKQSIEQDPNNAKNALYKAFDADIKYQAGIVEFIRNTTPERALEVAQEAANDPQGLGKLKSQGGELVYVPTNYSAA